MVVLGGDVVGYQFGGSAARGPARIASLYALDKLKKSPTVMSEDPLKALAARLGPAPSAPSRSAPSRASSPAARAACSPARRRSAAPSARARATDCWW
jgi:hypothetical protein